jgi:SAM-dependent methyltransferase
VSAVVSAHTSPTLPAFAAVPPYPGASFGGEPGFLAATRAAYDAVAVSYARLMDDALAHSPFDRSVLALYAELVRGFAAQPGGSGGGAGGGVRGGVARVAEVGCGSGRITAHLASLGLAASGMDLSPAMVGEARRRHPGLSFSVGSMTALEEAGPGEALHGVVAWYSVIHVPPSRHRGVYAGFRRVLMPGGLVLLAFQCGDERRRVQEAYGHGGLALDAYRLRPERVEADLEACGFAVVSRMVREPVGAEQCAQAYVVARALES